MKQERTRKLNNKIIVLWGFIIVMLVCAVYFIGIKYENEIKYINLKTEVKEAAKKYVDDKELDLPFSVTTEILESEGYIGELKLDDKVCAADITVSKRFIFHTFDIKFTCVNVEA